MKHIYTLLILIIAGILPIKAQHLTLEYNIGYATYSMNDPKDFIQKTGPSFHLNNLKVNDNFPGYITHEGKIGLEWKSIHQAGILLGYINTVGNKGVADYSGSYNIDFRIKGIRLGAFYRFTLPGMTEKRICPYLQLSSGTIFNNGTIKESLRLEGQGESNEKLSLGGTNFFIEPAIGCKIKLLPKIALTISVGYEWDISKKFTANEGSVTIQPDWSGLRIQGGVIYYIPFSKH